MNQSLGKASQKNERLNDKALAPLSKIRPATLDNIEKAVHQLFAGDNAQEVTMIQIAKAANVSLQTLYKYFGDKQTVFHTIMDRVLGRLAIRMMDHLQGIDSVEDRIRKTLWVVFDFVDTHPDAVMVLTSISATDIRKISIYENEELIKAFTSVLLDGQKRGVLNDSVPLYVLFDVFMGFVMRIGMMQVVRKANTPLTDSFDDLFNILWRAISKPQ
ncbi:MULTISPECIES: TetR/AcrR family transcriptional regulator [Psychrobacter]|uniref:TetR family transcriptional regulator n=2 Tax=Psychrobacter TaxID=497 RepID=A0A844M198_9GAMM|nr:TetR/AcrR family transcriptional regulator [Psychrobacter sp. PraFG1]MUG32450.1 TetR family transcriptional regulator [Psychrobacter sanguinis]UNK06408.1 TetR/AcrR family transcriptional regulator [Psychrobacter sp. PraFG1]